MSDPPPLTPQERAIAERFRVDLVQEHALALYVDQRDWFDSLPDGVRRDFPAYVRARALAQSLGRDIRAEVAIERDDQRWPRDDGRVTGQRGSTVR